MKLIDISTPKHPNTFTMVDDEDFEVLNRWDWHALSKGNHIYAIRAYRVNGAQKQIYMHSFICKTPKGMLTDHINRNGLDNRKENLRICTRVQNQWNAEKKKNGKNKYKGVGIHNGRIFAIIRVNGKDIYLGTTFKTLEDAALAYNKAAIKYRGEFAYLNTISQTR